ncbi:MAG: hypothetical protein Q9198_010692, partial [Flavoplaca austrocitrina]
TTHVEAFDNPVEFRFAPRYALAEEFGTQSFSPQGQMAKDDSINEVVWGVAELFQGGDESCLVRIRSAL